MTDYEFLYQTDSETDDGYRVVAGETFELARREWVSQMKAEGQDVCLMSARTKNFCGGMSYGVLNEMQAR